MSKKFLLNLTVLMIGTLAGLLISEITLRLLGSKPWQSIPIRAEQMNQFDPELGWVAKAGSYTVQPYTPRGKPINYNFDVDGARRTSLNEQRDTNDVSTGDQTPTIIIVGCSFSQGWAISDNDTYAWNLQKQLADLKVFNYATQGYGTYQSLLRLERTLPKIRSPKLVIYGFIDDQERRNVATSGWLELLARNSQHADAYVPYVTLDKSGKLLRHSAQRYIELPFRESFAYVALIEKATMNFLAFWRTTHKREITEKLILEMKKVSEMYGANFLVALLDTKNSGEHYLEFLKRNNVHYSNCSLPRTDDLVVEGEGHHPNAKAHALFTECIRRAIVLGWREP